MYKLTIHINQTQNEREQNTHGGGTGENTPFAQQRR